MLIINDILDFSKIEAGKVDLEKVEFNLPQTVRAAVDLTSSHANSKGLKLSCTIAPGTPTVLQGDSHRLRQVLLNLINNAIKFTEEGEVSVEINSRELPEEKIEVNCAVRDTGIGMTEETRQKLFQPFTQADSSTTRKFGGTGLGLAISHKLIDLMGGQIGVKSALGSGSTFWFTVPLAKYSTQLNTAPADSRPRAKQLDLGKRLRVLVVEDGQVNQRLATYHS